MLGFRKSTLQTISAIRFLARHHGESPQPLTAAQLAQLVHISAPTMSKSLLALRRQGLITSQRGRGGGYRLRRPPAEIRLSEIARACGETIEDVHCLIGDERCSCPLRQPLDLLYETTVGIFDRCDGVPARGNGRAEPCS
jgi:Rrf2 family protein